MTILTLCGAGTGQIIDASTDRPPLDASRQDEEIRSIASSRAKPTLATSKTVSPFQNFLSLNSNPDS